MIDETCSFYKGFTIDQLVGNNAFSFDQRSQQSIFVPPLMQGNLDDLAVGDHIVFSEFHEGVEHNKKGLRHFVYMKYKEKHVFLFDNHNHAFFFWMVGVKNQFIDVPTTLVHIDQHKDMRKPDQCLPDDFLNHVDLFEAFSYTNEVLNVGNFIQPAQQLGVLDDVVIVDSAQAMEQALPEQFILDIDIDFFSSDMKYIDEQKKLAYVQQCVDQAQFITVATSPYFIDQAEAIEWIKRIFV